MRILFLESEPMWIHGLPNGFRDLKHEVMISGAIQEEKLNLLVNNFNPDLLITIGWTSETSCEKKRKLIQTIAKTRKIPHVYWATEDPTHTESFTLGYLKSTQPDFVFTICKENVVQYKKIGWQSAHLDFGFHSSIHYSVDKNLKYDTPLALVANGYPYILKKYPDHYRHSSLEILLLPLIKEKFPFTLYGKQWLEFSEDFKWPIPHENMHGRLPYLRANQVYSSTLINIGLQNKRFQVAQRTYEILASGGFLLTLDTPAVREIGTPGEDFIVSSSANETIKLVQHYLSRPDEREKIRRNGFLKVAKHSYRHRAEYILEILQKEKIL